MLEFARSQTCVSGVVHEILVLLVDKDLFIPMELRQIRRVSFQLTIYVLTVRANLLCQIILRGS